jgi:hypothetical protein
MFRFVALADHTRLNMFLDHRTQIRGMEIAPETVQRPLDTLMAIIVDRGNQLVEERRGRRDVEPAIVRH